MAVGIAVLATNLAAAVWGTVAWVRRIPSVIFWYLLRIAQAAVIVQVAIGIRLEDVMHTETRLQPIDLHVPLTRPGSGENSRWRLMLQLSDERRIPHQDRRRARAMLRRLFRFATLQLEHAACRFDNAYRSPPSPSSTMWSACDARPLQPGNRIWQRNRSRSRHIRRTARHAGVL